MKLSRGALAAVVGAVLAVAVGIVVIVVAQDDGKPQRSAALEVLTAEDNPYGDPVPDRRPKHGMCDADSYYVVVTSKPTCIVLSYDLASDGPYRMVRLEKRDGRRYLSEVDTKALAVHVSRVSANGADAFVMRDVNTKRPVAWIALATLTGSGSAAVDELG